MTERFAIGGGERVEATPIAAGHPLAVHTPGRAEVEDRQRAVGTDEHVVGMQVRVADADRHGRADPERNQSRCGQV